MTPQSRKVLIAIGLFCVLLALAWQSATVHYNYGGNWTALFCTGDTLPFPPSLASERVHIFREGNGYDGQFYHYIAHDPFFQRGLADYVDAPKLRYPRILMPGLAYALAAGRSEWIDPAYIAVTLMFVFLGAYWLGGFAGNHGRHPAWGFCFLFVPAVIISLDRLTIDVALAALVAGFAYYVTTGPKWKLYLVLLLAPLARETGVLLIAAYCLHLLWERKLRETIIFATSALPSLGWYIFVRWQTWVVPSQPRRLVFLEAEFPFGTPFVRMVYPQQYEIAPWAAQTVVVLDYVALLGVLLAMILAYARIRRGFPDPMVLAVLLYGLLATFVGEIIGWHEAFGYTRTLTPLLLLVGLSGVANRDWLSLVPLLAVVPRLLVQLAPQAIGVARGLTTH